MTFLRFSLTLVLLFGCRTAWSQATAGNAVRNGGFERTIQSANIWQGTDRSGYLFGSRATLPVLLGKGEISSQEMPMSVAVGDLNGDGLPDIASADPMGYVRIFFNSGSRQEPKFTYGEITTPILSIPEGLPAWRPPSIKSVDYDKAWNERRRGVRIGLVDSANTGKLDMVVGNYFGEIFFIPNRGSANSPQFQQPEPLSKAMLPTMKDPNFRWGNLFAPLLYDWDGDRRPDLIIGEGSYSANNVHLFFNQGSPAAPAFSEDKRQVLALGEGRQQLHPALADVDGDGTPDLLVIDRDGLITAYIRPKTWKVGDSMRPSGYLAKDGGLTSEPDKALKIGSGIHTISTGDLNGDGLFDLVVGKPSTRIAWAPNKGTKDKPKFDPPTELQGDKNAQSVWAQPSGWEIDLGISRGNFYAYANCLTDQDDSNTKPKEGTRAVKFGYDIPAKPLVTQALNFTYTPPPSSTKPKTDSKTNIPTVTTLDALTLEAPSNLIFMRQETTLQIGKTYNLSMQIKGSKVSNAKVIVHWTASKETGETREIRGERGAVKKVSNRISDNGMAFMDLRSGASWSSPNTKFKVEFPKQKELNSEPQATASIIISFELGKPDGTFYLDDIKLVPEG